MKILITGIAGFIGNALALHLARQGHSVAGIDNINAYYDPRLKIARLRRAGFPTGNLPRVRVTPWSGRRRAEVEVADFPYGVTYRSETYPELTFTRIDITDLRCLEDFYSRGQFDTVIHLAAQAGVRYSIENPLLYVNTNVVGFTNLLECARKAKTPHFIYASSSSVYGDNADVPFSESDRVDSQASLYAATKKCDEVIASTYSRLYGMTTTGLRFFTVYGPWGRPDMAPSLFADAILDGRPIDVFNNGDMTRDFTYIDDIVEGVAAVVEKGAKMSGNSLYNIGCGHPERLGEFIKLLEQALGKRAALNMLPMQTGDVPQTWADTTAFRRDFGMTPGISLSEGIGRFARWRLSAGGCPENFDKIVNID